MSSLYGVDGELDYLDQKIEVLGQLMLGLDKEAVKSYIARQIGNVQTESKREIRIDNLSRTIMNDYFNGDRSFCARSKRGKANV